MVQTFAAGADRPGFAAWWSSFVDFRHHVEVGKGILDVIFKAFSNVEERVRVDDVAGLGGPAENFIS